MNLKALIFILSAAFSYFQRGRKFSQERFSSVLLSAETLKRRKSGLLLLIPTASFQTPPPSRCEPLVVPTYHTRRRPR